MSEHFPTASRIVEWFKTLGAAPGQTTFFVTFNPLLYLRELATMLRGGIPLPDALAFSAESFGPRIRLKLDAVRARVEQGDSLSEALTVLPKRWIPDTVIATVAAAERAGRLPDLLEDLSHEFERLGALDRRVRSTLVYPLSVLTLCAFVMNIVILKVIPTFSSLYGGLGLDIPLLTRIVRNLWFAIGPVLMIALPIFLIYLMATIRRPLRFGASRKLFSVLWWRLPVVRGLRKALIEIRFARTLRLLLDADVPLPEALDLCEKVVADEPAGAAIVSSARRIRDGEKPSQVLSGLTFLSPSFLWFLADCERRGDFLEVTRAMADAADETFSTRIEVVERVLEPASVAVLGAVVGTTVMAVYQATFSLIPLVGSQ